MPTLIYDLECEYGHRFEGWFQSLDNYESQREKGMIACPQCQSLSVRKVPSRLNIGQAKSTQHTEPSTKNPAPASAPPLNDESPEHLKVATAFVMAKQAMQALLDHSEDVGQNFVEEARKIYYEEAPARAIRGQASLEQCEELRDEGIDIIALPSLPDETSLN